MGDSVFELTNFIFVVPDDRDPKLCQIEAEDDTKADDKRSEENDQKIEQIKTENESQGEDDNKNIW